MKGGGDMYYFLGVVLQADMDNGIFTPAFVVAQAHGTKPTRSQFRVVRTDGKFWRMRKVLVTSIYGNDWLIDFMRFYRTRDAPGTSEYEYGKSALKGALCWFECNQYGEANGTVIIDRFIPDAAGSDVDEGFQRLKKFRKRKRNAKEILMEDAAYVTIRNET